MKKFLIIIALCSFCLSGCGNNNNLVNNQEENNNYTASRITVTDNLNNSMNTINTVDINNINTETEISSFSTKIYTPNDEARQTNIKITCSKLDGTVVKSRRNFFIL